MMGSGNKKYNSQIKRNNPQFQDMDDSDKILNTPNQKLFANAYNVKNNINNTNSITKQNNRFNINTNTNTNIKTRINDNNIDNNNINLGNNNNINQELNNSNNNINKALMILRSEFKKKNDRIKLLELKVADLERKINMIQNSNNNNNNNTNNKNINLPFNKNFTFAEQNSGEINIKPNNKNEIKKNDMGVGNYRIDSPNINNYFPQTNSSNQFKISNNKDMLEPKYSNKISNLNEGFRENSLTGNSSNSKSHSKNEVKTYLKEVKGKVDPFIFKEFIKNIKLLTASKEKNGIDKSIIVENVKILFGEQYKDLFIKFESIIGVN
jgi:hypothetical protein